MRINTMVHVQCILRAVLLLLVSFRLNLATPQVRPVNQDVAEPDEYGDGPGGRRVDEWWRNYEAVEDHVSDLDDHLEMFYMYSVNPLEVTTVRATADRGTPASLRTVVSPFGQSAIARQPEAGVFLPGPVATPTPFRRRSTTTTATTTTTTTTTTTGPPVAPPFRSVTRSPIARRPGTLQPPQPTEAPFVAEELQPPVGPSRSAPSRFPQPPVGPSRPVASALPQSPVPPSRPVLQTFVPRRPSTFTTSAITTESPVPVFPVANPELPSPQRPDWEPPATVPEQQPVQRGRVRVRVRRPPTTRPSPSFAVVRPGVRVDTVLPLSADPTTVSPQYFPEGPGDGNDIGGFSQDGHLQPAPGRSFPPAAQDTASLPGSRVTVNPFLAPAHVPPPLPRYSRLLNRYSILDEIGEIGGVAGQQSGLAEAGRSVRQPSPVIDTAYPPSARNFDNATAVDSGATTSRRPRRRRLRTTTVPPTTAFGATATVPLAVYDSVLSDSEEILVSQQPGKKLRTTRGRFAPSEATTPATPDLSPLPQEPSLPPTAATGRPLFTGKRRRTTAAPSELAPDTLATGDFTITLPPTSDIPNVDPRTTLFPRPTFVRPDWTTKARPLFVETSTAPPTDLTSAFSDTSGSVTDAPISDDTVPEANTESFRFRPGKFQTSRRSTTTVGTTAILEDTTEVSPFTSPPLTEVPIQPLTKRIGKFRPKPSNPRLFGPGAVDQFSVTGVTESPPTTIPSTTLPPSTEPSLTPTLPLQSSTSSKFKPRPTFRRTTTTSATVPTVEVLSTTEELQPEPPTSRVKPRGSKFRGPASTAVTETPDATSSTETVVAVAVTEARKFKPRSGFPRFQDSAKRSAATTTRAPDTVLPSATTTATAATKPLRFKPKPTLSRFQPGAAKTLPPTSTEAAESLLTTLPLTPGLLPTGPEPPQRPLFRGRTTRVLPSRTSFASTLPASSGVPPGDLQTTVPPLAEVTTASSTFAGRKQRRRPGAKKSPLQTDVTEAPTSLEVHEPTSDDLSRLPTTSTKDGRRRFTSPAVTPSTVQTSGSESLPPEWPSTAALLTEPPQRRKFRRRKLTQRSTQSAKEISGSSNTLVNLTTAKAIGKNVSIASEMATTHSPTNVPSNSKAAFKDSFTSVDKLKSLPLPGSRAKNSKQQLSLEQNSDLEEPLEMEADETGDDSGIWFSDSASIRNDGIESFGGGGGGGSKQGSWFQIEPESSSIKNPSRTQLRHLSDSDDSKSWFGLADAGAPKAAESSPEKTTIIKNESKSTSVSVSTSDGSSEGQKSAANPESPPSEQEPKLLQQSKSASFSVSSSTSVHAETSKSRASQSSEVSKAQEEQQDDFRIEEGSPKIIIIDKVTLDDGKRDGSENVDDQTTTTTTTTEPSTPPAPSEERDTPAEDESEVAKPASGRGSGAEEPEERPTTTVRSSRDRDRTRSKSSRDQESRSDKSTSRSSSRGRGSTSRSSSRSSGRDRDRSSRRDRGSTTTTTTTTTTTSSPETTESVDINETTKKKSPSDEVGYFGEEEVAPVAHGVLDGPAFGGSESGVLDSFDPLEYSERSSERGEVASVDVSEHNDPNDRGHNSESAAGDESSLWELSPLSEFSGPIRESSSFKVEVRSKPPKLIQLAARREAKSARSGLNDDFSKTGSARNKVRSLLKMIALGGAAESEDTSSSSVGVTEVSPQPSDGGDRATVSKTGLPLKGFAYPVPPMKTAEDIAELFEIVTIAPMAEVPKPFRPLSKATVLKLNGTSTTENNATSGQSQNTSRNGASSRAQVLDGPTNCSRNDRNLCPTSEAYPRQLVELVVKQHEDKIKWLWQELQAYRTPTQLYPNDVKRQKDDLSVCDSTVEALQPGWARDAISGKWMIIVNTLQYPQVLRVESCLRLKKECLFISPYYKSSCVEHYSAHRMVAIHPDDPASGPVVGIFKFPCGCSCRVGMFHGGN